MMADTEKVVSTLEQIVGKSNVVGDPEALKAHALDGKPPRAVVFPGTIEEVSKILTYANREKLAVLPKGNGTKMGMGAPPKSVDIVLVTARLNRVPDSDVDNLTLTVEAGMTLKDIQDRLARQGKGYFLPLDPPHVEKATLGGIVATNASGARRFLYGTARDLIIGMKGVFPNGDIVHSGGKTVKNVSGYDLCKLLIGSMGSLGILCEMTFKLLPLPEKEATLVAHFEALEEARDFVHDVIHSQLTPAAVEVLDGTAARKLGSSLVVPAKAKYVVVIGSEGVGETIDRQITDMSEMAKKRGALKVESLGSKGHADFWIALRNLAGGLAKEYANFICLKSNFLISKWAEAMGNYEKIARELAVDCAFSGHAGNGILYSYLLVGKDLVEKVVPLTQLISRFTAEAVQNEGNLVVEMSPATIKEKVDVWGHPRSDLRVVRSLKAEIDPAGILNPGRFVGGV